MATLEFNELVFTDKKQIDKFWLDILMSHKSVSHHRGREETIHYLY